MPENLPATTTADNDLALRFPVLDPNAIEEIRELQEDNLGPRGLTPQQIARIKVPSGASLMWTVKGLDGEEAMRELPGIVLAWTDSRLYYKVAFADRRGKGGPPDCVSADGFYGVGDPGGECRHCPMAKWGSDPKGGRGQACKQVRRIVLLREGLLIPDMITVPPTSLGPAGDYFTRLLNHRIPYYGLVTTLRLERTANADGIDYARIVFSGAERFNQEQREILKARHHEAVSLLRAADVEMDFEHRDADDNQ